MDKPEINNSEPLKSNTKNMDRKQALQKIGKSGKKIAFTVLPFALLGLSSRRAVAQFDDLEVARALNFILRIEFMQEAFYVRAATSGGLLNSNNQEIFTTIRNQHQARVVLVKNLIGSLDVEPAPQLSFNFRSGGQFNPFSNFDDFLNLAQVIEDLAAGVYKKQAENIYQNNASTDIKRTVLRLHSTESRHAYFVRSLRAQRGLDDIKGWIDQADLGTLSPAFENIYSNEDNILQEGIDVPSISDANVQAIQEAWDEPLGRGPANDIFGLFTNPL